MTQFTQNSSGILGLSQVADKLAEFGRNEDTYIVHASEGETVIPAEVFKNNPNLKQNLFRQMESIGLDPNRYVVGNQLNSINPVTGQPEFFLKKIFSGVKKVIKKVAPTVLPVALSLVPGLGPIYGGALGTGVGTLLSGGSAKDALKNSLIAGGIGGLFSGLRGGFRKVPGQDFMSGFEQGISQDLMRPFNVARGLSAVPLQQGSLRTTESQTEALANAGDAATISGPALETNQLNPDILKLDFESQKFPQFDRVNVQGGELPFRFTTPEQPVIASNIDLDLSAPVVSGQSSNLPVGSGQSSSASQGKFDRAKDILFRGGRSEQDIVTQKIKAGDDAFNRVKQDVFARTGDEKLANARALQASDLAQKSVEPGLFQRFGPSAAIATGIAGLAGAFDTPEESEQANFFEQRYGPTGTVSSNVDQFRFATPIQYRPTDLISDSISIPSRFAANGGEINGQYFPRKVGAIYGPGTETSDDVPAMLSNGEFVMTAKAVRGAGDGSRKEGMKNMYNMMRNFEGAA